MRRALLLLVVCSAACGPAYRAGTLLRTSPEHDARAVGCLDVGVELADDGVSPGARPPNDPIVKVVLGNTCERAAPVHFEQLRFTALYADGSQSALVPYDPRHELAVADLGPLRTGEEKLLLQAPAVDEAPEVVCVDVSAIGDTPVPTSPLCRRFGGRSVE